MLIPQASGELTLLNKRDASKKTAFEVINDIGKKGKSCTSKTFYI